MCRVRLHLTVEGVLVGDWFFLGGRWYRDGKRRRHGPWNSSYFSQHVAPPNRPKFVFMFCISVMEGMCTAGFDNSTRLLLHVAGRWRSTSLTTLIREKQAFGYIEVSCERYVPNIYRYIHTSVYRTRNCKLDVDRNTVGGVGRGSSGH